MSKKTNSEPEEILNLFGKRSLEIKPGLERIRGALQVLGNPGKNTFRIVVGGTNGKGSTSGILWRLLATSGIRVGLFSSPHLREFRERITVSDRDVSNELIVAHIGKIKSQLPVPLWEELTFFEINTLLAFCIFDELQTDVNILEVGLGGRLDCVNVYDPTLSVITSIGLDHQEFLGSKICQIAREKSGIMRSNVPIVWSGQISSCLEADLVIRESAANIGAQLFGPESFHDFDLPVSFKNRPKFLQDNFKLAARGLESFCALHEVKKLKLPKWEQMISQFDGPHLPWPVTLMGRFHLVEVSKGEVSRRVLVDVCHNPHGAAALSKALQEMGIAHAQNPKHAMISILADKDASGIWDALKVNIDEIMRFQIPSARSWAESDQTIRGRMYESFDRAWQEALGLDTWSNNQPWLLFGSVAAVGYVWSYWMDEGWNVVRINEFK